MNKNNFSVIEGNSKKEQIDQNLHNENPQLCMLKVIDGGKEKLDELFFKLISRPAAFGQEEFEYLCDVTFKDRLERGEAYDLGIERLKAKESHGWGLEKNLLLSIFCGDDAEHARLTKIIKRRNELGLTLVVSEF
jgi:hypothetical protein